MHFEQKEVNLHTHTLFSHHGKGMPSDYLSSAKESGNINLLGFSEHTPLPDPTFPPERLQKDEIDQYIESVRGLCDDAVTVLLGFECDWRADFVSYYEDELMEKCGADYLLGSVHYLPSLLDGTLLFVGKSDNAGLVSLSEYVDAYTSMLSSGLFLYGCHPDLFAAVFHEWNEDVRSASEDIIACALDCGVPLEINGNGLMKRNIILPDGSERHPYPWDEFWRLAIERGVKIVTSSDAHKPEWVSGFARAEEFASPLGVKWAGYDMDAKTRKVRIN